MSIKYYQLAKDEELPDEFCAIRDVGGEPSEYTFYVPESDVAKLRELWGEAYDEYAAIYKLEEIYDAYRGLGSYHGTGADETEAIRAYVDKIIENGKEDGCVKVDAELGRLLQLLMDKYTFKGVDYSWLKLCYYYEYLG